MAALRAEEIDLEHQHALVAVHVEQMLERRVGEDAAVPVVLAVDIDGRKARRQGGARHDVLRPDAALLAVEVDRVALADVGGADAEAHVLGVEQLEIDEPLERGRAAAPCRRS